MKDLRYKLSEADRLEIKKMWDSGCKNYSYIALKFKVHPKTIRKVVDEKYRIACNEFNKQNWKKYKPSKEHHAELTRIYRKRKKEREE